MAFFPHLDGRKTWFPQNPYWMDRAPHGAEQGHSWGGSGDTCATQLPSLRFLLALSFTCSSGSRSCSDRPLGRVSSGLRGPFLCTRQHANPREQVQLPADSPEHQKLSHRRAQAKGITRWVLWPPFPQSQISSAPHMLLLRKARAVCECLSLPHRGPANKWRLQYFNQ